MKRDSKFMWAVFSDDNGVSLFGHKRDAEDCLSRWRKAGANWLGGPYPIARTELDKAAPAMLDQLLKITSLPIGKNGERVIPRGMLEAGATQAALALGKGKTR